MIFLVFLASLRALREASRIQKSFSHARSPSGVARAAEPRGGWFCLKGSKNSFRHSSRPNGRKADRNVGNISKAEEPMKMKTVQTQIPENLYKGAVALAKEGSHQPELMDRFLREDVEWGIRGQD
jgi:hypothetical protein